VAERPSVLFVCVRNSGKSQMAAGLMRHLAGDRVQVSSAGTDPGAALNALSVEALLEVGVDVTDEHPKPVTAEMVRAADLVVTLGLVVTLDHVPGTRFETWDTDEPSTRGIDGMARMRLIRDDINARVQQLNTRPP
jgi:arsenate-mycothiol transferase